MRRRFTPLINIYSACRNPAARIYTLPPFNQFQGRRPSNAHCLKQGTSKATLKWRLDCHLVDITDRCTCLHVCPRTVRFGARAGTLAPPPVPPPMNIRSSIITLGWLKKKESRRLDDDWTILNFDYFIVCLLRIALDALSATVYWGSIYKLLPVLLDAIRCFPMIKSPCKHWLEPPFVFGPSLL